MRVRVGHLYPEYLNIYADRGNIAVLARRAEWRGIAFEVVPIGLGDPVPAGELDLLYVGGGQDREQALVAPDIAGKADGLRAALDTGAVALAVCGGYQLLGRAYVDTAGRELPGAGILPLHTEAGTRRMIGDVLLDVCLDDGGPAKHAGAPTAPSRPLAGFENHAGRTLLDPAATPLGRVVAGHGNDGASGFEGCVERVGAGIALGTYLHGPLLPRNPWLADWLLARALARHVPDGRPPALAPLPDTLERAAHEVAAARARERGGR